MREQWLLLGVDPEQATAQLAPGVPKWVDGGDEADGGDGDGVTYELWPESGPAWHVFLACATQWRLVVGFAGAMYQGLDYASVRVVMDCHGIRKKHARRVLDQVRTAEHEALKYLNEKSA